ncbi:MAG TPA: hypothetical protein VGM10_18140 [Actinocrinis sp.]
MAGSTALVTTNAARISSSSLPPSSSQVISRNGLITYGVSALCTSTSTPPHAAATCSTMSPTAAGSRTSACTAIAWPPASSISAATRSAAAALCR